MEASHLGHWNASNALLIGTLSLHPLGHFTTAGIFGFQNQGDQGREFSGRVELVGFLLFFDRCLPGRRQDAAESFFVKPPM